MRSLLSQGGTFSVDRVFYATLEARRLPYAFTAASGGEA
jgi:hypothetical protein